VIHTVGPIWHGGAADEERLLANCYRNSIALASEHRLASVAFPAISCGVYGYPHERACQVAVRALRAYPWEGSSVREVVLTAFDASMLLHWQVALASEQ
jgi:O-acetyl-ADP-ribose deacetylase (regulator of RNase III)